MKDILREIGKISRCFESIANIEFKPLSLSKNQYVYLVRVAETPGIILETLCEQAIVDKSTASRAVNKLVDQNLIEKVDVKGNGKSIELHPTDDGKALYDILRREEEYSMGVALKDFSKDEIILFNKFLTRMRKNVEPEWLQVKNGEKRKY